MIDNFEKLDRKIRDRKAGKQDEVFDAIGNDKIDKFFENYEQFDEFLVTKNKNALIYSGHVFLDAEVSGKLYSDFCEAFDNSIKGIVGEKIFERMQVFFENKDYLLSNGDKRSDSDPFLDDKYQTIVLGKNKKSDKYLFLDDKFKTVILGDNTVAQFFEKKTEENPIDNKTENQVTENEIVAQLVERRNTFNNVEFHYIVYPNRIFKFIDRLCKDHNLKI